MAKTFKTQTERKLFKRSALAACVMTAAAVHAQAQETTEDPALLEEVVVYGIKQSLQNAQDIKRDAATVKDVITASDIGALPDKSIVEALQRVPGVAMERFQASDDPDHFAVEGGSVNVRGLTRVRSEFNGRDAFSADSSGGLNFDDISPELVGAVEVSKNQTADMVEGGIAGNINLITRKPFDKDDLVLGFTVKGNYVENIEELTPQVSGIVSNVWDTDAGKFGALFSVSASNVQSRGDGIGAYNYYNAGVGSTFGLDAPNEDGSAAGREVIAPLAARANQQLNDRDRLGISSALQWSDPSESVKLTAELIHSSSELAWTERFVEFAEQPFSVIPGPIFNDNDGNISLFDTANTTFDCDTDICSFESGNILGSNQQDYDQWPGKGPLLIGENYYLAGSRGRSEERAINDFSFNIEVTPNDNLTVTTDLQWVNATTEIRDNTIHGRFLADVFLDTSGDGAIDFLETSELNSQYQATVDDNGVVTPAAKTGNYLQSPESYFVRSAMDHRADNEGDAFTFSNDIEYQFDDSVVRSFKTGIRYSKKEQIVNESVFNWGNLSEVWNGPSQGTSYQELDQFSTDNGINESFYEEFTFENHAGGGNFSSIDTFLFPSLDWVTGDSLELFYNTYVARPVLDAEGVATVDANGAPVLANAFPATEWANLGNRNNLDPNNLPYLPSERFVTEEDRKAAYIRVDLGDDNADIRWDANVGLRYVSYQLTSSGANTYPAPISSILTGENRSELLPALNPAINDLDIEFSSGLSGETFTATGEKFTDILPSLNIKLEPVDDLIVRFAASKAIFLPRLDAVRNQVPIDGSQTAFVGLVVAGDQGNGQGQLVSDDPNTAEVEATLLFDGSGDPISATDINSGDVFEGFEGNVYDADGNSWRQEDGNGEIVRDGDGNPVIANESLTPLTGPIGAIHNGFTSNDAGNPFLQPEVSTNIDLALEWYFDDLGSVTATLFYKDIKDFFRNATVTRNILSPDGSFTRPVVLTQTVNAGSAIINGIELAGTTNLGFIHESLSDFGIQTSYTYIDGKPKNTDTIPQENEAKFTFRNFTNLPLEGLSDELVNFTAFYQNDFFEARLAYSWRSEYLLNSRDVIAFSPVYSEATGQLDFSTSLSINDQFKVGFEATNLTEEVIKTRVQYNQEGLTTPRSFFGAGRTFGAFIKGSF